MAHITNQRAEQLMREADAEFDRDGGLAYTRVVLSQIDRQAMIELNATEACVKLCTLHRALLQEYARVVLQLEAAGATLVPMNRPARGN